MLLIGQYDSPFVRRVGIALRLYKIAFEHRPWSVWADAATIARYNPLRRVPVLVLDDGLSLVESSAILDALDGMVSDDKVLLPRGGRARIEQQRICAFATGVSDKAVSLFYERLLHPQPADTWLQRCLAQIGATLDLLEGHREALRTAFWFGHEPGHADIAVAVMLRFIREVHPGLLDAERWPALHRHSVSCEALPVFQDISQPFELSVKS